MRRWGWLLFSVLGLAASLASAASAARVHAAVSARPRAFSSCASLVSYASGKFSVTGGLPEQPLEAAASTGSGAPGVHVATAPSAASAAGGTSSSSSSTPAFSTTNDQEQGVDEPDIVKTDGTTIFTVSGDTLYAVTDRSGTPRLAGSLALGGGSDDAQLLLSGSTLLVIGSEEPVAVPLEQPALGTAASRAAIVSSPYYVGGTTVLSEVDVADPSAMSVTETMSIDGRFVDARENGSTARLVISSSPQAIVDPALRASSGGWLPTMSVRNASNGRAVTGPVVRCDDVLRPAEFSGLGMLTILTVDLDRGLASAQAQSLMADAQVVYGSASSLYIATQRWIDPVLPFGRIPQSQTTVIDRFDVTNPDLTTFVASGEVPGYLLNQFSLSDYEGYLRVASTSRPIWWDDAVAPSPGQSSVTVLASEGSELVPVGQVSGLGEGEQISSVRFVDDTGYVSTFRQIDPLYTIDLSNPNAPRVSGQLELEGDSAYLQPLGNGLLLGVGQSVDPTSNEPTGALVELFDVSDPAHPKLVQQSSLGAGSSTQVTDDHHAFLFWPATDLVVLPVQISAAPAGVPSNGTVPSPTVEPFTGAVGFRVDSSGLSELGQIAQDSVDGSTPVIERSLVIGDQLLTLSSDGVMASNLDTLAREGFLAFPTPLIVPTPIPVPIPNPIRIPIPRPTPGVSAG